MTLENIIEKIETDAQKEASSIINAANEEARAISKKAKEESNLEQEQYLQEIKVKAVIESQSISAKARMMAKEKKLVVQRKAIDSAFDNALVKLNSFEDEQYEKALMNLLKDNASGTETVLIDYHNAQDLISNTNEVLSKLGKKGELKVANEKLGKKGFLLKDKHGMVIDLTFDSLVDYYRESLEMEVLTILSEDR